LVSLIERVELTENKQIIIKFRFRELEAISLGQSFTIGAVECFAAGKARARVPARPVAGGMTGTAQRG
uniref:hypothetical protein n=1 Tax=Gemmiger formicilis TaxID=745368 RepID=UPI004026805B